MHMCGLFLSILRSDGTGELFEYFMSYLFLDIWASEEITLLWRFISRE